VNFFKRLGANIKLGWAKVKSAVSDAGLKLQQGFDKLANKIDDIVFKPRGETVDDLLYEADDQIERLKDKLEEVQADKEYYQGLLAQILQSKLAEKTELSEASLALKNVGVDKRLDTYLDLLVKVKEVEEKSLAKRQEYFSAVTPREQFLLNKIAELEKFKSAVSEAGKVINIQM
jgi:hypothetical protein